MGSEIHRLNVHYNVSDVYQESEIQAVNVHYNESDVWGVRYTD